MQNIRKTDTFPDYSLLSPATRLMQNEITADIQPILLFINR